MKKSYMSALIAVVGACLLVVQQPTSSLAQISNAGLQLIHSHDQILNYPQFPQEITVLSGNTITVDVAFKGDPGLFDPSMSPHARTTDGHVGDVLKARTGGPRRKDAETLEAWQWVAARPGTAEISVQDFKGVIVAIVKVTVLPLTQSVNLSDGSALPKSIALIPGQRVSFMSRDIVNVSFRTTDGQNNEVISFDQLSNAVLLAPGWQSFSVWQSERSGAGEFTVTWRDAQGTVVRKGTVPATVR